MRHERGFGIRVGGPEPGGKITHEGGDFCRGWELMRSRLGPNVTGQIRIAPGDVGAGALHHQPVQVADVAFGQGARLQGKLAHIAYGIVVIDRLEMVFEGLAADGDPLFDDKRRFNWTESVALYGV